MKIVVALTVLLFVGQKFMTRWFDVVARRRSQELFMLNLLLVTLGAAFITDKFGLSLALGAFIAGMLIAETPYRHQVEEDIKPFRDVLLGLFFVTTGMLLNPRVIWEHPLLVLGFLVVPILLKAVMITGLARLFGAPPGVAMRTGLGLAQAGEFGFVLLNLILDSHLVDPVLLQAILSAMLLSMLAAPFIIQNADRIVLRLSSTEWMLQSLQMTRIATQSLKQSGHVIICGYGRAGQNLARMLEHEGLSYVALDLDPDRVAAAAAAGESVVFGDAGRRESLLAAGLHRAATIAITYANTPSAMRVLHNIHELRADAAGDRAHRRRRRSRKADRGGRDGSDSGDRRGQPDAGVAYARADGRADAARRAARRGNARRALQPAARLFPRRRRSRRRRWPRAGAATIGADRRELGRGRPDARIARAGRRRRRGDGDPPPRHSRRRAGPRDQAARERHRRVARPARTLAQAEERLSRNRRAA